MLSGFFWQLRRMLTLQVAKSDADLEYYIKIHIKGKFCFLQDARRDLIFTSVTSGSSRSTTKVQNYSGMDESYFQYLKLYQRMNRL